MAIASDMRVVRNLMTLRELTLEKMRGTILSFRFKPGDRLVERDLCEQLGVSRSIVREVLRHLDAEGLVEIMPQRGPIVANPTMVVIALATSAPPTPCKANDTANNALAPKRSLLLVPSKSIIT